MSVLHYSPADESKGDEDQEKWETVSIAARQPSSVYLLFTAASALPRCSVRSHPAGLSLLVDRDCSNVFIYIYLYI